MSNKDDWKAFVNNLFVNEDGSRKKATITLKIESVDGDKLVIPLINVSHTDRLIDIFKKIEKEGLFAKNDNKDQLVQPKKLKTLNVEHIKYRNAQYQTLQYIVKRMEDDSYVVQLETGGFVEKDSPTYKGVVKKYKKEFLKI